MTGSEFVTYLKTNNKTPFRVKLTLITKQGISKKVFDSVVWKQAQGVYWVNFHIDPAKFTESDDPNYFRIPKNPENPRHCWGVGEYPVFQHKTTGDEYVGLLPCEDEPKTAVYYTEGEDARELPFEEVVIYLPKKEPPMEGYPVYFNVKASSIISAEIIG